MLLNFPPAQFAHADARDDCKCNTSGLKKVETAAISRSKAFAFVMGWSKYNALEIVYECRSESETLQDYKKACTCTRITRGSYCTTPKVCSWHTASI
jgi:hypothetical protein